MEIGNMFLKKGQKWRKHKWSLVLKLEFLAPLSSVGKQNKIWNKKYLKTFKINDKIQQYTNICIFDYLIQRFIYTIDCLIQCFLLKCLITGEATVENSMEFPQKTKNGTAFWPSNSTAGIMP